MRDNKMHFSHSCAALKYGLDSLPPSDAMQIVSIISLSTTINYFLMLDGQGYTMDNLMQAFKLNHQSLENLPKICEGTHDGNGEVAVNSAA